MQIAPGTIIAQKYRLEAQLARGGMGAVWVARHVILGSRLAIKFLDPRLAQSPAFVTRFEREARAAAAIESPHVVHVLDFGVEEGTPYLVMELLRGEDLRARLRRVGRLSLAETAHLLVQVGKALRRAHEAGIVHRDIKPGNLFLARIEDDEVLKVLDFGIAKEFDAPVDDCTKTGEIVGSPHYVSPEQGRGDRDVDHRADVWSVGVIAYRMLTANLPFPGEGLGNVLSKVLTEPPPPVRVYVDSLPSSLDAFFAKALAKRREARFQSVRDLVDAFVAIAQHAPTDEDSISEPSWSSIRDRAPLLPQAAPPAAAGPLAPDEITRLDSLTPTTGAQWPALRAASRRRWAATGIALLLLSGGAALFWCGQEPATPATSTAVRSAAPFPATLPEAQSPAAPPRASGAPVAPALPAPPVPATALKAAPPGAMTAPRSSPTASSALTSAPAPTAASMPAPAPAGLPTGSPTAPPAASSKEKWGF